MCFVHHLLLLLHFSKSVAQNKNKISTSSQGPLSTLANSPTVEPDESQCPREGAVDGPPPGPPPMIAAMIDELSGFGILHLAT